MMFFAQKNQNRFGFFPLSFGMVLLLIFITVSAETAFADVIRGTLSRSAQGSDIYLTLKDTTETLRISPGSPQLASELARLSNGDTVTGSGWIRLDEQGQRFIRLDAIESVGLQEVLGVWKSDRWEVFEFQNFSRLNLYVPTQNDSRPMTLAKTREFTYILAPERGSTYSIFLSDNTSIHVGSLEVSSRQLNLIVFDSQTGHPSENISLSPLPVR